MQAFTFKVLTVTDTDSRLNACIRIEAHPRYVYNTYLRICIEISFRIVYILYSIGYRYKLKHTFLVGFKAT